MAATRALQVRAVGTVDDIPAEPWDALAGTGELYLSAGWLRVLEATSGAPMRYLLAYDGAELAGGLPTARADEHAPWLSGRPDTLLERCVREERPGAAEVAAALARGPAAALLPATVCGGRHLGRNRVLAATDDLVERLVREAEDLARDRGDRSVSFLYVDDEDRALREVLAARGYHHYGSARYSWLPVPRDGYPGYLAARSRHRRRRIRHERGRLREAGVTVEIERIHDAVVPRMAELETNLLRRHGMRWSSDLSERIFTAIATELGEAAFICAARLGGELTGFTLFAERGSTWYAHRAGFDYEANGDLPVYFDVTFYRPVEAAAERGIEAIHCGTGSDQTKASRGCRSTAQHAYTLPLATAAPGATPRRRGQRVEVRPIDRFDEPALDGLYELQRDLAAADVPDYSRPCRLDVIGAVRFPWPATSQRDLLAWDGRRVVGAVRVVRADARPHEARLDHLLVHPARRRAGIGTALLRAAWDAFDGVGVLTASVVRQTDGGLARDGAPEQFARSHGATEVSRMLHLRLAPATTPAGHEGCLPDTRARWPGYSVRHWGSAVPEPHRDGVAQLLGLVHGEEDPTRCLAHLEGMERMRAGRQRHSWDTGIWHDETAELVAWSSVTMAHSVRERATQGMTIVSPSHRGRRLGLLVKLANLAHATAHDPRLAAVDTYNAATNTPVIALNRELGYRHVDDAVTWRLERGRP